VSVVRILSFPFALGLLSCAPDAHLEANFASGFVPARRAVSVFGVFKDGQLSADAWEAIGPRLSPALGARFCEPGYGSALRSSASSVASAIDDYARDNGMTDDLLAQLAPAAKGDLLLVVTFAGQLPVPPKSDLVGAHDGSPATTASGGGRGGMGMGGGTPPGGGRGAAHGPPRARTPEDTNELDVSASFYSVAERRSVGIVAIAYKGATVDDALSRLSARVQHELPAATCAGWDWTAARLDPEKILHGGIAND